MNPEDETPAEPKQAPSSGTAGTPQERRIVIRAPDAAPEIVREAIAIGAKVMWMQLGIRNDEAAKMAEDAGLKVVMNRCPKIEYGRLSGEIGWVGVNRRVIDNRKPFLFGKGGTMKHRV